jgi:hypothetical protein
MGIPPPADSNFAQGRRKFLGKKRNDEDRNGVPRLEADVSHPVSGVSEAPSHPVSGAAKERGPASSSKDLPPTKTKAKSKKAVIPVPDSSSEFEEDADDDMYVSDNPKPRPKPVVSPLAAPWFSDSPRATRSARMQQQIKKLPGKKQQIGMSS